jgi:hypothetical protein
VSAALQVYLQLPENVRERLAVRAQALREAEEFIKDEKERGDLFLTQSFAVTFATLLLLVFGGAPAVLWFVIAAVFFGANLLQMFLSNREFNRLLRAVP